MALDRKQSVTINRAWPALMSHFCQYGAETRAAPLRRFERETQLLRKSDVKRIYESGICKIFLPIYGAEIGALLSKIVLSLRDQPLLLFVLYFRFPDSDTGRV
jgi:hypothetical protein